MKLRSRIPYTKLVITLIVLQLACVAFVHFREQFMIHLAQGFIWVALLLMGCLLFLQKNATWTGEAKVKPQGLTSRTFKTAGLFLFFMIFLWQINYLSLYQMQPLMYTTEAMPVRYDISPGDLLGVTLRLALQSWVLAVALALVFNRLPKNSEFGFIRGQYQKLSTLAWYLGNMSGAAVITVLLFSLGLLTLDIGKFITKSAGSDVMNVPQFDLVVLLFSFYLFNVATGFSKRLTSWGEQSNTSPMFVIGVQLAFVLFVYCMVRAMMVYLPEETVSALMQPFYFDFLDHAKYPGYWQLFVTTLSIFLVPLLAHYFYHACQGERVVTSVIRLLVVPIGLCLAILQAIPFANTLFWESMPSVSMFSLELNNITSRYEVTWISYLSVVVLMGLMLMLQRSKRLKQCLVDVMPEQVGRRARRMKAFYARAYPIFIALLSMYLLAGVVVSLYFTSIFLLATLLGLGLCFVAGLKHREA